MMEKLEYPLAQLLLLTKFDHPTQPRFFGGEWQVSEWTTALGKPPDEVIQSFLRAGVLVRCSNDLATLNECLQSQFGVKELKQLLKERGLHVSGSKAKLIEHLLTGDPEGTRKIVEDLNLVLPSEEGRRLIQEYRNHEEARDRAAILALIERRFEDAIRVCSSFEAELGFPKDDAFGAWPEPEHLARIITARPKILKALSEEQLEHLRLAAGMVALGLDAPRGSRWLPDGFTTGLQMDNDAAVRMIWFQAKHKEEMLSFREIGVTQVSVEVATREEGEWAACSSCGALVDRIFRLDEVPELPYEHCTSPLGCRCSAVVCSFADEPIITPKEPRRRSASRPTMRRETKRSSSIAILALVFLLLFIGWLLHDPPTQPTNSTKRDFETSSKQHLALAEAILKREGLHKADLEEARSHLQAVPRSALEYQRASQLLLKVGELTTRMEKKSSSQREK